jgi:N6-L-threonylcarbamoyladenine synthase
MAAMTTGEPLILGVESSCDETSVALVRGGETLGVRVASQEELHREFGGVVPEVACRAHMEVLLPSLQSLLEETALRPDAIDAIAVTNRPGLIGALLVGLSAAKGLALGWRKPLVAVDHIEAHITAARLAEPALTFPFVALVVSGGHTTLYEVRGPDHYRYLGGTRDDAAGEAFDKVAAILDLPYPGGPSIERTARGGDEEAFPWRRACLPAEGLDLSFSGIKTAVLYAARGQRAGRKGPLLLDDDRVADAAASFQRAAVHALVTRALQAAETRGVDWIALGGGVAANGVLRATLTQEAQARGRRVAVPPIRLCTDNAVMVAARGAELYAAGRTDPLSCSAAARSAPAAS